MIKHIRTLSLLSLGFFALQPAALAEKNVNYETLNIQNLSKLYWKYGALEPNNREALDAYMAINECSLYRNYKINDIEWTEIIEAAAASMDQQAQDFNSRFEISQAIKLQDYDARTEMFQVYGPYKIDKTRAFHVSAYQHGESVCGTFQDNEIPHHEMNVVFKTDIPIEMSKIQIPRTIAQKIIERGNTEYALLPKEKQKPTMVYETREAFLFLKMRVFKASDERYQKRAGFDDYPQFNAVLEGMAVYANADKTDLIFQKDFRKVRKIDDLEKRLRAEYAELREKAKAAANKK